MFTLILEQNAFWQPKRQNNESLSKSKAFLAFLTPMISSKPLDNTCCIEPFSSEPNPLESSFWQYRLMRGTTRSKHLWGN
jgi:hypothetical protein